MVLDFLSRLYLVEMLTAGRVEDDQHIATQKNKIFLPFKDRSRLLERIHRTYTGHLRLAKLYSFLSTRYFWTGMFNDAKNVCDSCLTCARIHSTVDYSNMKSVKAAFPFQIVSLDTGCITYGNEQKTY